MAHDFREKLNRELDLLCAPISRAVTATLVEYNRVHGTVYDFVGSGEDARGVDAIASSQRPGESALRFQVTFVDTEGRLRASIAKGESYSAEGSEQDLLDRFADSLHENRCGPSQTSHARGPVRVPASSRGRGDSDLARPRN